MVHPEPSPGPGCAVMGSSSVPAHPPPSSRKPKGHPGPALSPVGPRCSWGLKPAKAPGAVLGPSPCFLVPPPGTPELHSSSPGSVTLKPWSPGLSSSSSSDSVWPLGKPDGLLARGCGLDLLNRSLAIQLSGRSPPGGPETQDRGPDGLPFLGDSWSGATVVRRVLSGPGSARVEPKEVRPPTLGWGQS